MRNAILLAAALSCLATGPATALMVTLNSFETSRMFTHANDQSGSGNVEYLYPSMIPYSDTSSVTLGGASSTSTYSFSSGGFDITFDHARVGTAGSFAVSWSLISFSVDEDVAYTASGSYDAVDSDGRRVSFYAHLEEKPSGNYLFRSLQTSLQTPDESFSLLGNGGDHENESSGSPTGVLIAGRSYELSYDVLVQAAPAGSSTAATASGQLSLNFASVPEPGTGLLVGLGLALLGFMEQRTNLSTRVAV